MTKNKAESSELDSKNDPIIFDNKSYALFLDKKDNLWKVVEFPFEASTLTSGKGKVIFHDAYKDEMIERLKITLAENDIIS